MSNYESSQNYIKLCAEAFESIRYILYTDHCKTLRTALGKSEEEWVLILKSPAKCYNLVKEMEFILPRVYKLEGYRIGKDYPSDWTKRIALAMNIRDRLEQKCPLVRLHRDSVKN